jgi:hypothetical protein
MYMNIYIYLKALDKDHDLKQFQRTAKTLEDSQEVYMNTFTYVFMCLCMYVNMCI